MVNASHRVSTFLSKASARQCQCQNRHRVDEPNEAVCNYPHRSPLPRSKHTLCTPRWARQPCTRASIIRGTTWAPKNVASDLAPPSDNIRLMLAQNERVAETCTNDQSRKSQANAQNR